MFLVNAPSSDLLTRAVMISLFTWRRAEPDDDTDTPMGWWGDTWPTVQNDRIGSRLYLLKRRVLTNQTAQKAKTYILQALEWMKEDGVVSHIEVKVTRPGIDKLSATVHLTLHDDHINTFHFPSLWSKSHAT